ncbi:uncharacterized protein LOC118182311 [Stegodyphus dumicola]|uniref:uncharacterized protein LOC118182311 n=1 Tax=Stegodyphus dumicola TaxID=202533 RepID=UPI0015B011C9|nr:uncharacterized protein LOC118182311 [Stegodyphus dumicola]
MFKNLAAICGAKLLHTTPYHLQCNGKIKRFHRTLKAAIKAHNNVKWSDMLPTILLGLRAAIRDGTNYYVAQMVYGTNIRLPGEFFEKPSVHVEPDTFVYNLQQQMALLKPMKSVDTCQSYQKGFVHRDLRTCTHVFVRVDRVKKPLEPAYDGPFPVAKRHDKYYSVHIKGKDVNISIDRLKPAYLMNADSMPELPNQLLDDDVNGGSSKENAS